MKKKILTAGIAVFLLTSSIDVYADQKEELQQKVDSLKIETKKTKEKQSELNQDLKEVRNDIFSTNEKIDKTRKEIKKLESEIDHLNKEIEQLTIFIKEKEIEIDEKHKELMDQKEKLGKSMSYLYENKDLSILEFLFFGGDLSELLNGFDLAHTIADENDKLYESIKTQEKELKKDKESLVSSKESVTVKKEETLSLKDKVNKEKEELNKLLQQKEIEEAKITEDIANEKKIEEAAMAEIISAMEEIETIIKKEEEERKRKEEEERRRKEEALRKQKEEELRLQREKEAKQQSTSSSSTQSSKVNANTSSNNSSVVSSEPTSNSSSSSSQPSSVLSKPMKPGSYRFTSDFGYRSDPFNGVQVTHSGVDLAAPVGTPIIAASDGYVVFAGPASGYGNWVVLYHGNDLYTIYGHMYSQYIYVKPNQYVKRGETIAGVGSAGQSTGPHLHFSVAKGRSGRAFNYVNPNNYLNF